MQAFIVATKDFQHAYKQLGPRMQKIVDKKIRCLATNYTYPSLQAHRLKQARAENVWICYITITKRLLYQYKNGSIYLWDVGEHSIVERVHLRNFA
ncbi:MAG: hypothetical protein PVS3B3_31680 [Ktedonobacteraceae bacterium]